MMPFAAGAKLAGHRLVAVHADEGLSGALPAAARSGLAAALDMIRTGDADALVLPKLDRLARTLSVQEAALASVWAQGGRVFLPEGEVLRDDPDDPMRTAMRQMMGVFSQLERGMITARLRAGRAAKASAGGYAYGSPPYGWRADKTSPTGLAPVPTEQTVIRRMVAWRAEGIPMREMARRLNAESIPPKRRVADRNSPRGDQALSGASAASGESSPATMVATYAAPGGGRTWRRHDPLTKNSGASRRPRLDRTPPLFILETAFELR